VDDVAEELGEKYGWFPVAERICKVGEHWKAIPWYPSNQAILVRKDLLLATGEPIPSPDWTWEDLLRIAKKIKDVSGVGMGFALGHASGDANQFCYPLLWSYGGKEVEEDGRTIAIDSLGTRQALRFLKRLYDEAMLPGVLGWDDGSNNRVFLAGVLSMTNNSGSIYWASKKANPYVRANMTHLVFPDGPAGKFQLAEVRQYVIFKYTRYPELAKDLIRYVMEKEQYLPYMALGEGNTSPPLIAYTEHPMWEDPALRPFIQANEVLQPIGYPGPVTREAAETHARFIIVDMFANVARGVSIDEAISKAADEMISIYRR
jgi:multiple sugar transport system substrate-binding protein